jgi:tetratricopeptide (TPR) repeat protein
MEEASTQLADTRPILDKPLRVAIPVNVPARNIIPNRDNQIYTTTFSPTAVGQSKYGFYHTNFKEHKFYSLKPTNTVDKSVSMFTPIDDAAKLRNITEKVSLDHLPIPSSTSISSHSGNSQSSSPSKNSSTNEEGSQFSTGGKNSLASVAASYMKPDANLKNLLNDYQLLSVSSRRANKKDVEAMAYASLGVLSDNQDDYLTAINYYNQYLKICEDLQDLIGISSAYNCIGINYMLLVNPLFEKSEIFKNYLFSLNEYHSLEFVNDYLNSTGGNGSPGGITATTNRNLGSTSGSFNSTQFRGGNQHKGVNSKYYEIVNYINLAIISHQKHLDTCPDLGGKFIANINLGICYQWMNALSQAAFHFQDGLRIAIKMQTLFGQSIAVGNLGLLALNKKDFHTARTCFDQVSFFY